MLSQGVRLPSTCRWELGLPLELQQESGPFSSCSGNSGFLSSCGGKSSLPLTLRWGSRAFHELQQWRRASSQAAGGALHIPLELQQESLASTLELQWEAWGSSVVVVGNSGFSSNFRGDSELLLNFSGISVFPSCCRTGLRV